VSLRDFIFSRSREVAKVLFMVSLSFLFIILSGSAPLRAVFLCVLFFFSREAAKSRSRQGVIYGFFFLFSCFLLYVSAPLRAIFSRLKIHFLSFSLINLKKATKLERSKNHLCIIESFLPSFWHLLLVPV